MMVIVQWVLQLAPIGVFALVFPFAIRLGFDVAGALGYYLVLLPGLCVLATLALYPISALLARIPVGRFALAAAPAQAVAFSTRSSLASLPAMLRSARKHLALPPAVTDLALPLAVTLMRITSPIVNLASALFVAALYGIDPSPIQIVAGAAMAVVISLSAVGLPSQVSFMAVHIPVFMVVGAPLEPLGLLLAVEVVPDTFMTVGNVTAHMAVTAIVARRTGLADASEGQPSS